MKRVAVLALSKDENGLFSVLIEFSSQGTSLRCARSGRDAAFFLSRHRGALILCDRLARDTFSKSPLSRAIEAGNPCAVVWIEDLGPQRIGIEIDRCGDLAVARRILGDPAMLQKIHVAWGFCRQCSADPGMAVAQVDRGLPA